MRSAALFHVVLVASALAACSSTKKTTGVPPSLAVDPASVAFKTVRTGGQRSLPVTLTAQTPAPVQVSGATIHDPGDGAAAAFALSGVPARVEANGTGTLTVTFTPGEVRSYAATLTITSNDESHPSIDVALTGRGATEAILVSLENPPGANAALEQDGGLSIGFVEPLGGASGTAWPEVLVANVGGVDAQLTSATVTGDGFSFTTAPATPQTIAPEQTRAIGVQFAPPAGSTQSDFSGQLQLAFDDPANPAVTVALTAHVAVDQPPVACAAVLSAQELDGTIQSASAGAVAIEPGARVQLTAFSDDIASATPACTYDPEDGRSGLQFLWTVTQAPAGSRASLVSATDPRPTFVPDLAGDYVITLQASDAKGASSTATVGFTAAPLEDLSVVLAWPGQPEVDLDLHLVRPGARPFQPGGDVSSLTADGGTDWGIPGDPTDDARFSGDDIGSGALTESASVERPGDSCLGDGGCSFGVWVHYFQDRRDLDGGSCGQTTCFEGSACGCSGPQAVCEPGGSGAVCGTGVAPVVQVFLKGQTTPAIQIPLGGAALAAFALPSPCFTWHALEVAWLGDGGASFVQPGDGGSLEYWGDHTNAVRECVAGSGGYAPTSPPLLVP